MEQLGKTEAKIISLLEINPAIKRAYEKTLEYFSVYDIIEHTNHCHILRKIYNDGKYRQKSVVALSLSLHTSERTLTRYRKKYLHCISVYFISELMGKEVAATDFRQLTALIF